MTSTDINTGIDINRDISSGAGTDPRILIARAIATALPVVDGVRPDQLHLPTPCADFDVDQLLGHLVFAIGRAATVGHGGELALEDEVVTSDDWSRDVRAAAADLAAAWADDARLDATIELPWASMTGAQALGVYTNEVTVHTWDLARATGQTAEWDADVVAAAAHAIHRELPIGDRTPIWQSFLDGLPEGAAFSPPFDNAIDVADGAPAIEQLVAWNGRRP